MNSFVRKQVLILFSLFLFLSGPLRAEPKPEEILQGVKDLVQAQSADLLGQLRTEDQIVPFILHQADGVSEYRFEKPAETVRVTFADSRSTITGVDDPKKTVRGSLLSYDDLALRFLYWTEVTLDKTEKIRELPCWRLRLVAPNRQSAYSIVYLWVIRQSGAFLRAEALDWEGNKSRRFEVIATQTIHDRMMLKQMRIQNLQDGSAPVTYLEITGEAK